MRKLGPKEVKQLAHISHNDPGQRSNQPHHQPSVLRAACSISTSWELKSFSSDFRDWGAQSLTTGTTPWYISLSYLKGITPCCLLIIHFTSCQVKIRVNLSLHATLTNFKTGSNHYEAKFGAWIFWTHTHLFFLPYGFFFSFDHCFQVHTSEISISKVHLTVAKMRQLLRDSVIFF